jgi:hypothetical protein
VTLRLVHADRGFSLLEPSTFKPVLARDGDRYTFYADEHGDFTINMLPMVDHAGVVRATFQFVDLGGLHADSAPFTLCFRADFAMEIGRQAACIAAGMRTAEGRVVATILGAFAVRSVLPPGSPGLRDADGHVHGPARPLVVPQTFRAAIEEFSARLHAIDTWIAAAKYNFIPTDADAIGSLATLIPSLSASPASGVPVERLSEFAQCAAGVKANCQALSISANWSDSIAVREPYDALSRLFETFDAYVPRLYRCPMGCEGEKAYSKAGKCPVCRMALADTRAHLDHKPKHGGTFFMAPDYRHHLEGVLGAPREFRVYFYDEFTKPIAADFDARAKSWKSGDDNSRALALRPNAAREYLSGNVPPELDFPLRIKMFVDFRDGAGPQVFDFEFERPVP